MNKFKKVIDSIHQDIAQQVKSSTYLNILEEKVMLALSKGTVTHDVMHLLDLEPDIIHYDDEDIYFELIEKWAQIKDAKVLEEFYMNAEKDFLIKYKKTEKTIIWK